MRSELCKNSFKDKYYTTSGTIGINHNSKDVLDNSPLRIAGI